MKWLAALLLLSGAASARTVPWTFRADFQHGFTGWMSYPLPQDIGFDPTLSVEQAVLIRQVASVGQANLSVGFIRPLHFLADSRTRLELRYSANWPSSGATLKLLLAGENGRKYEAALPAVGVHEITVTGTQLHLPSSGVAVEAIVLMGQSNQPAKGSSNRIELRAFELDAARLAEVPLKTPTLLADTDRTHVAAQVIDAGEGLPIELRAGASPVRIAVNDGAGHTVVERALVAPGRYTVPLGTGAHPGLWTAHLQTPEATSEFSFLVLGRIPAHPRALLSEERLTQLRNTPILRKQIHEQAQAQSAKLQDAAKAGVEIATLPPGSSLRASVDGELDHYFQLVESYSNAIASNALDYALTQDPESLKSARRDLLAVSRWPAWTPPRFAAHGMQVYYETGVIAQRLAFAYDLIASGMSVSEQREVADAFWTKCIEPTVREYFTCNRMPTGASNWMSNSLGGALAAALAVAGDVPGWRNREGVALAQLLAAYQQNLRGLFPGDGGENEPAGYEHFAMEGLSWGAAALRNLDIQPAGMDRMLQGFWWPDYAMVRPNLVLDTGDFNGELRSLRGFAFGAEFGGMPALRAFYDRVDRAAGRVTDPLDLPCCTHTPDPTMEAPPSRIFAQRGSAVLRSGWGADATVVSLRAGPWFNHEHHDQGSFQVAAFGTRLISEAGYASYYLDPNYAGYFMQASGHNTVLVDADAFSQGEYDGPLWKALDKHAAITGSLLSPSIDYVVADLAPAYAGGISAYTRQYLFFKPDVLIVRDDLRSVQPHVFTWLLHAAEDAHVEIHGPQAEITAGDAESSVTASGPASTWEVRATPLPASVSQILGNVVLHPGAGERKVPHREALSLSSSKSTQARFEVAMQFRRRSTPTASSDTWSLFRNAPGELRSHGLASDASVFAGRGADTWIAIGARSVQRGGEILFTATAAANAAWNRSASGLSLDLHLHLPTTITVRAPGRIADVSVDGAPVQYSEQNGRVQLSTLNQGEHRVRIFTRTFVQ